MKIVFLSYYSGQIDRGVETLVDNLATNLSQRHEVTVYQAGKKKPQKPYQQIIINQTFPKKNTNPISIIRKLFLDSHSLAVARFTLKASKYLKNQKPDIIIPTNGGWQVFHTANLRPKIGTKIVVSGQAGLGWDERWNLKQKPDLYIAPSSRNAKWVQTIAPKQHLKTIPNGVDCQKFKSKKLNRTQVFSHLKIKLTDIKAPIVLCVAAHENYKRVEETIQAVSQTTNLNLIVVGGSSQTHRLGEKLLPGRFQQLKLSHEQMPQIYQVADLFTLVSDSTEAFGISYLEAMATNLPVVATDDELRRELVDGAGLFVKDPTDSKDYAAIIQFALNTNWSDKPRNQAKKFDWIWITSEYEKAMNTLVK